MHSIDLNGNICVNLQDYNELSDSIRFLDKINYLVEKFNCPKEISNFSISMIFKNGQCYYISNLYFWAIPYRTEGLYRGDVDHDTTIYKGKEFFIQRDIKYDEMQMSIVKILESRYNLNTTFAMIRQCPDCDFIIEVYNKNRVIDPENLYYQVRNELELFIVNFLDSMQIEIKSALPNVNWLPVLNDREYRKDIITRQAKRHINILSTREIECLLCMTEGMSMKEAAKKLNIANETVNSHAKAIRRKLNSKNIAQAVLVASKFGLLSS